jgi:hypothetical protein
MIIARHKVVSFALLVAGLFIATASMAGSDRWMMNITEGKMGRLGLVHVSFVDQSGGLLDSKALQRMEIKVDGCDGGDVYKEASDYKYGYRPSDKKIGVFLLPESWKDRDVCFKVPGMGQVQSSFPASAEYKTSILSF